MLAGVVMVIAVVASIATSPDATGWGVSGVSEDVFLDLDADQPRVTQEFEVDISDAVFGSDQDLEWSLSLRCTLTAVEASGSGEPPDVALRLHQGEALDPVEEQVVPTVLYEGVFPGLGDGSLLDACDGAGACSLSFVLEAELLDDGAVDGWCWMRVSVHGDANEPLDPPDGAWVVVRAVER